MTNWMTVVKEGASAREFPPIHPGEVLKEEFLEAYEMSRNELAKCTGITPQGLGQIVLGKRAVTADTALRLARFFNTTPEFWLNLQARYDLEVAAMERGEEIAREVPLNIEEWLSMGRVVRQRSQRQGLREGQRGKPVLKMAAKAVGAPRGKRASKTKNAD